MKQAIIIVSGKVQNVGFRYFTNKRAMECNIKGYVKNQPDGTVYIEAEGEDEDMNTFLDWIRKGPRWGRVDNISIQEIPLMGYSGFEVR